MPGGTNTDAVAIDLALTETKPARSILSTTKTPTTPDTSLGINTALRKILGDLPEKARDDVIAVNVGTTVSLLYH